VFYALGLLFLLAGGFLLVFGSRLYRQPKVGEQVSVWRGLAPVLEEPPQRFYARLYQTLKASLQDRLADHDNRDAAPVEVVLTGMGFGPHRLFAAPSLFAERPLYLLVRYKHLRCYIYAGQTPTGLFISSWGYSDYHVGEGADRRIALTKKAWKYFSRQTLFQVDATIMFTFCVQEIISQVVDGYREEKGLQPMEALERRPILHAFYQNPFYRDHYSSHAPSPLQTPTPPPAPFPDSPPTALFDLVTQSDNRSNAADGHDASQPASQADSATPSPGTPADASDISAASDATEPLIPESSVAVVTPPALPAPDVLFPMDEWLREDMLPHEDALLREDTHYHQRADPIQQDGNSPSPHHLPQPHAAGEDEDS
jgi:hypothetical protein